jgi:hypothetical protein
VNETAICTLELIRGSGANTNVLGTDNALPSLRASLEYCGLQKRAYEVHEKFEKNELNAETLLANRFRIFILSSQVQKLKE